MLIQGNDGKTVKEFKRRDSAPKVIVMPVLLELHLLVRIFP